MGVTRAFRAPLTRDPAGGEAKIAELRALPYAEYLLTPHWRRTRNTTLGRAGWTCQRCASNVALQVHHLTYERLGAERETDLEVLCQSCHEGLHHDESRQANVGVYLKLASDAVRAGDRTFSDLTEAVHLACRQHGIPARARAIAIAVETVLTSRWQPTRAPIVEAPSAEPRPFTHVEAAAILRTLGLPVPLRSMPSVRGQIDIYGPVRDVDDLESLVTGGRR